MCAKKDFKDAAMSFLTEKEDIQVEEQVVHDGQDSKNKNQKMPRINIAFSEENLNHLKLMTRINGISMTAYVNSLVEEDKKNKSSIVEQAKKLFNIH